MDKYAKVCGLGKWSSRLAHNQKIVNSNFTPATLQRLDTLEIDAYTINQTLDYSKVLGSV